MNKALFKIIVILALLPLVPAVLAGMAVASPLALAVLLLFGLFAFNPSGAG